MLEEGFLRRWARRKTEIREGRIAEPGHAHARVPAADALAAEAVDAPLEAPLEARSAGATEAALPARASAPQAAPSLPTMEDVAALGTDSDFSAFVARGVDQAVRRGALKKLFADPHFQVMDRLDIYIDDYTKASPVSEAMLASLAHAKSTFMRVVEEEPRDEDAAPPDPQALAEAHAEPQPEPEAPLQQPPEQETQ
jgi:hypothetical protein